MTTALAILAALAAVDVVIFAITLALVGHQYHRMRRIAAAEGAPLPSATGQFLFIGLMLALGFVVLLAAVVGLTATL